MDFGGDRWVEGRVVSWDEWNSGPYSDSTHWALKLKLVSDKISVSVGDLVQISGLGNADDGKVGTLKNIDSTGKCEVSCREPESRYEPWRDAIVDAVIECELENIAPLFELEVVMVNVKDGGVLKGGRGMHKNMRPSSEGVPASFCKKYEMPKELDFEWLDPPVPELPEAILPRTCYHNSSEEHFNGKYQEAINLYLDDTSESRAVVLKHETKKNANDAPDYTTPEIEKFVKTHPHLVNTEFCDHVYANCVNIHSMGSAVHNDVISSTPSLRRLLTLATNLRYRYVPGDMSKSSVQKMAKYARDIHTERGISRILSREVSCPCTTALGESAKKMNRVGVCFNCNVEKDKADLKECAKCLFARYCNRECQVEDWPNHKATCKVIRREMNGNYL